MAESSRSGARAYPTPPPLPEVCCYRCNGAMVRTWVVENPTSENLGKRFYKCSAHRADDKKSCRFGFMWHEDYGKILKRLGVIHPSVDLYEEGSATSADRVGTPCAAANIYEDGRANQGFFPGDCLMLPRLIISIGILMMSIAQLVLAVAIFMRP